MRKSSWFIFVLAALFVLLHTSAYAAIAKEKKIRIEIDDSENEAWLGVKIRDLDRKLREELDTKARYGAVVEHVLDDTPAEEAGIEPGDVIVKFDDVKIRRARDLTKAITSHEPGDEVTIELMRGKERKEVTVVLSKRPHEKINIYRNWPPFEKSFFKTDVYLGMTVQEMDEDLASYFDVSPDEGVLITEVEEESPADKAGLKAGDVLVELGGEKVNESEDIGEILEEYEEGDEIEVTYIRKGEKYTTTLVLEEKPGFKSFRYRGRMWAPEFFLYPGRDRDLQRRINEDMKRLRRYIDEWRDMYEDEMRQRIKREIERAERKQERVMQKLQEEIEKLRRQVEELKAEMKR